MNTLHSTYNWDYLDQKAYNNKVGIYKFKRQFSFVVSNFAPKFGKILDVAGGSGRFALPLRVYTDQISVIDINECALKILHDRDSSISIVCDDFMNIDFYEKYPSILCMEALGYFPDWEAFFDKINTLLTDDGRIIISYQNPESWRFVLRKIWHWKKGPYAYKDMKLKEFKKLLLKCNLEIEEMEGMNWMPLPLSSNSIFVTFFEAIEKIFFQKNWYSQSPWLLISMKKS